MAGAPPASASLPFDPPAARGTIRVTNIYATAWRLRDAQVGLDPTAVLRLGRLGRFYEGPASQLPRILHRAAHPPSAVELQRWESRERLTAACSFLFGLPSGQVVAAFSVDVSCSLLDVVVLLEDGYYGTIRVNDRSLEAHFTDLASTWLHDRDSEAALHPERHQLVFAPVVSMEELPSDDTVQRLVYRSDLPYRREFSSIAYPPELNRRPTTVGAVGPYVSVVAGHQDYLENSLFLSAVQVVGGAARLREVRGVAYEAVRAFRGMARRTVSTQDRRRFLAGLAEQLGDLEVELSFSVETTADLGMLVPALRTESFHQALCHSMDLVSRTETVARMLARLERSIHAELTSVESIERRADEQKRLRWAVTVGFLTTVAAPLGLLFAFFGINTTEVVRQTLMLETRYIGVYLFILGIVTVGVLLFLAFLALERRSIRQERPEGAESWAWSRIPYGRHRFASPSLGPDQRGSADRGPETAKLQ